MNKDYDMINWPKVLKGSEEISKGDTLFTTTPDGKLTNAPIHEFLLNGKEDDNSDIIEYLESIGESEDILSLFR